MIFYVASNGGDSNAGTKEAPFATVIGARNAVREEIRRGLKEPITVSIREGVYSWTISFCTVKNVAGNAMVIKGDHNRICRCEIHHVGYGGVIIDGGDRKTLTPSGNILENNHVHHISEIPKCSLVRQTSLLG